MGLAPTSSTLLEKITDTKALESLGIVLFQASDIRAITANSGPLAKANEYQVHYWFLNGRFTFSDGVYIDIAIPTVYFNYKQEVSGAAIDFELTDVDEMSEALQPVHNTKVNELFANEPLMQLIDELNKKFNSQVGDCRFKWVGVNLGTIHRHPGGLSTFSGTDLNTSVTSPGICYPFGPLGEEDVIDKPSFSSIMLHKGSNTVIGRTEYRTATSPKPDHVHYKKHRCITFTYDKPSTPNPIAKFLGEEPKENSYIVTDYITDKQLETINIHDLILDALEESGYNANTSFVKEENLSKKKYVAPARKYPVGKSFQGATTKSSPNTVPHRNSKEWRNIANEVEDFYDVTLTPYSVLITMSAAKRLDYFQELYEAVYNKIPEVTATTLQPMDIINLQNKIWLETRNDLEVLAKKDTELDDLFTLSMADDDDEDTISTQEMCHDLKLWGVPQESIDKLTPTQIAIAWQDAQKT